MPDWRSMAWWPACEPIAPASVTSDSHLISTTPTLSFNARWSCSHDPRIRTRRAGQSRHAPASGIPRCLSWLRHVPYDGGGAAPLPGGGQPPGERFLEVSLLASKPRRMDWLLAARSHSTQLLVFGGSGAAVFHRQ